ncbi:MAG: hypothetical protein A2148_02480 [Chloroflexi bacterium RBG_16_68_14]|nr:MAG: hypothetical protein A2148_02480 [Chloroflexi bacterium RBG_16_68_14]
MLAWVGSQAVLDDVRIGEPFEYGSIGDPLGAALEDNGFLGALQMDCNFRVRRQVPRSTRLGRRTEVEHAV